MTFVFYSSLKPAARRAYDKGTGIHGRYVVNGKYLSVIDNDGESVGFVLVVKGIGEPIVEVKGDK